MQVGLKFITPLWTADATGNARHVEGTGLMGSLRWWYEVLIRGMDGWACDPADGEDRCPDGKKVTPDNYQAVLCPACQVFGATGWAKAFRMPLADATVCKFPLLVGYKEGQEVEPVEKAPPVKPTSGGRGYYFPPGRADLLTLNILPRRPDDEETVTLVLGLLEFIRRNAALGAKTNLGYGLFAWHGEAPAIPSAEQFAEMVAKRAGVGRKGAAGHRPSLDEMFFAEVGLKDPWKPPDFADFKCGLRTLFRQEPASLTEGERHRLRHFLLGTVKGRAQASKVKMALLPDRQTLRVWGWVPAGGLPSGTNRDAILDMLHGYIDVQGKITHWREFKCAARDTHKAFTVPQEFLQSLMEV